MSEEKKELLPDGESLIKDEDKDISTAFDNTEEPEDKREEPSPAPSLELLLYDSDAYAESLETVDSDDYDSFLSDYKETIARTFSAAKKEKEASISAENAKEIVAEENFPDINLLEETEEIFAAEESEPALEEAGSEETAAETAEQTAEESEICTEKDLTEDGEQLELDLGAIEITEASEEGETSAEPISEDDSSQDRAAARKRRINSFFEITELFVYTVLIVMLLTNFVFRHSEVDGDSMMNTLHDGDHLIISDLFYTPDYGDIVVFSSEKEDGKALVKRVVALAGDRVDFVCDGTKYELYVNGEFVEEDYVYLGGWTGTIKEVDNYIVKEGEVFVLGDHRNNSHDSRNFGAIDIDCILGRVILRFYPLEDFGKVN